MPSYKSHIVHGELLYNNIDKNVDLKKDELKSFCLGPDAFMFTDYKTFIHQHSSKTKEFFEKLLKTIKINKLYNDPQVMAFLYGQIDHFALDTTLHPFIYYMTEGIKSDSIIKPHALIEMWIDDYIVKKYMYKTYNEKVLIIDDDLKKLINNIYKSIYNSGDASIKYNLGIYLNRIFDSLRKRTVFSKYIIKTFKTGDYTTDYDLKRVIPYLNKEHKLWRNPETNSEEKDSFDELWLKSLIISEEMISEVNDYLYYDKNIDNTLLLSDLSYDTALPCKRKQKLKYIKRY